MKGLLLSLDKNLRLIQIHPLLRHLLDDDYLIGKRLNDFENSSWNDVFLLIHDMILDASAQNQNYLLFQIALPDVLRPGSNESLRLPAYYVATEMQDEKIFAIFCDPIEEIEELYSQYRQKEDLFEESVNVLKEISKTIMQEPSPKTAARNSIEMVAKLFHARGGMIRLAKSDTMLERYAAYGLDGEFLMQYAEILPDHFPIYQSALKTGKPIITSRPQKDLGTLYAELSKSTPIAMTAVVPILSSNGLVGTLSLFFDRKHPILNESSDILENVSNELNFLLEKSRYFQQLVDTSEKLKNLNLSIVTSLSDAIETRDPYTKGHSERVSVYAVEIARNLGWDDYEIERLRVAGVLHDIGKVGIPDAVLLKPQHLNRQEYDIMKLHPELSAAIMSEIESFHELVPWVRYHHENFDGSGYPFGLKGNEIPMASRILAVADAFDAMTSDRPYREALPLTKVEEIFKDGSGIQWDPDIVEIGLENLDVIYQKTPNHYHIPEILDEFRKRIFHMNLLNGLYLYEYTHEQAVLLMEQRKTFSLAVISLTEQFESVPPIERKTLMTRLNDILRENIHFPILVSRYHLYDLIILAPSFERIFMRKLINRILVHFFQNTNLFYCSRILHFPTDEIELTHFLNETHKERIDQFILHKEDYLNTQ